MVSWQLCGCSVLGHIHTHSPGLTAEGQWLAPNLSRWVRQGHEPGEVGPWGLETGFLPRKRGLGTSSPCVKSLEGLQRQKGIRRPQTASDIREKQEGLVESMKTGVLKKIVFKAVELLVQVTLRQTAEP